MICVGPFHREPFTLWENGPKKNHFKETRAQSVGENHSHHHHHQKRKKKKNPEENKEGLIQHLWTNYSHSLHKEMGQEVMSGSLQRVWDMKQIFQTLWPTEEGSSQGQCQEKTITISLCSFYQVFIVFHCSNPTKTILAKEIIGIYHKN